MTQLQVDARELRCPLPVIRLAAAAQGAAAGTVITVLATDPAARHDIPAWCRMRNHELREVTEVNEVAEVTQVTQVTEETEATQVNEMTEVTQVTEVTKAPPADPPQRDHPTYLRFVIVIGPHRSNAAGGGTSKARWSRAT